MTWFRPVAGQFYNWGLRAIHQRLLGVLVSNPRGAFSRTADPIEIDIPLRNADGIC